MVMRLFAIGGTVFIAAAWVLTVLFSPAPYQGSADTPIEKYRAQGFLPGQGALVMSDTIGHEIFEVPAEDADRAQTGSMEHMAGMSMPSDGVPAAMPGMQMPEQVTAPPRQMPGMTMPEPTGENHKQPEGMQMPTQSDQKHAQMPDMNMPEASPAEGGNMQGMDMPMAPDETHAEMEGLPMPAPGDEKHAQMPAMNMPESSSAAGGNMQGMDMPMAPDETHAEMEGLPMPAPGDENHAQMPAMTMPDESPETHTDMPGSSMQAENGHGGGDGLRMIDLNDPAVTNTREVLINMHEWGFTPGNLEVQAGEVIRVTVRNTGNVPHEFMFMSPAGMSAVRYRLERADWNLLEHEAAFEKSIVMPGDQFEVAVKIEQPGVWMFMCMFPYHMQFGMMGVMATEGISMEMNM